ncbi:Protein of unknown function (DUF1075) [Popillia japonica]|uniref:Uncharacterized protein n=1 Tax=Popillia japonica TaxID=7064 RepID=A0AAW1I8E8_POPJA
MHLFGYPPSFNVGTLISRRCEAASRNVTVPTKRTVRLPGYQHKVNALEKKFLVWTGKYGRVEDVPSLLPASVVDRARSRMRIRVANLMMLCTAIASVVACQMGKAARARGESLQKQNLEWHRRIKSGEEV